MTSVAGKQGNFLFKSGMVHRHHLHQNAPRPYVSDCCHRLVQPQARGLGTQRHVGHPTGPESGAGGCGAFRYARNLVVPLSRPLMKKTS